MAQTFATTPPQAAGFEYTGQDYSTFLPDGTSEPLKIRSMVGLIPLFAVEILDDEVLADVPEFTQRLEWFLQYRPDLAKLVSRWNEPGSGDRRLLSLLRGHRMKSLLRKAFDPEHFLSPYGIRGLSRIHREQPYELTLGGERFSVRYEPGEGETGLFGGNSNWRGPIWMPLNYLLVESLQKFHHYYGDDFKIECPVGAGQTVTLGGAADELRTRLMRLFLRDERGRRPVHGEHAKLQRDPHFRDQVPFFEYFHGDTGEGLGARAQTGWSALVGKLLFPYGALPTHVPPPVAAH